MSAKSKQLDFAEEAAAIRKHAAAGKREFGLVAELLISVRDRCARGRFDPWLDDNDFGRRWAYQIMADYHDPEKREARLQRRRETEPRANSAPGRTIRGNIVDFPRQDEEPGDDDETIWRRGLLNRADEAVQLAAYEEGWCDHPVDRALVDAAEQAAGAWKKLAAFLRSNLS